MRISHIFRQLVTSMRKLLFLFWFTFQVMGPCFAQLQKGQIDSHLVPVPQWHYQNEYTFDITVDPASWADQAPGLHVAFGSTDELYLRSEVPETDSLVQTRSESGRRGERLNAQLLVWSPDTLSQVRLKDWKHGF